MRAGERERKRGDQLLVLQDQSKTPARWRAGPRPSPPRPRGPRAAHIVGWEAAGQAAASRRSGGRAVGQRRGGGEDAFL